MPANYNLQGKTVVITGGSRGIGLAIGKRLAQEGANIAILAKTADPHPSLPGTIYTAVEEINKIIGTKDKTLPIQCDIRFEEQVQNAIEKVVEKFGGIDILINNASAISITSTLDTGMKRYDLMHQINGRGTFLVSKTCIPYLLKSDNPHIVNISPPLNLDPKWFAQHVAYTMSKYNMSMCTLGMSEEFKDDGLAVNSLWPKTAIATSAVKNLLGGEESVAQSRTEEIMADACFEIVSQPAISCNGNFFLDEDLLRDKCINFEKYSVLPYSNLLPDFFLNEEEKERVNKQKQERLVNQEIEELKPTIKRLYFSSKM
ncbi:hypothetical protein ABK040_002658 [Willaertia magna]